MSSMHLSKDEFGRLPTAPPDPIHLGATGQRPVNYNSATGRRLFNQSHMPLGCHHGKIMERVPAAYLLALRKAHNRRVIFEDDPARPDFGNPDTARAWWPIVSYVGRHAQETQLRAETEAESQAQKPRLERDYILRLQCTLITLDRAAKSRSPKDKCELCHDNETEHPTCDCNPDTRRARNEARRR